MKICVPKETHPDETRVALLPQSVKKLVSIGAEVCIEKSLGETVNMDDSEYGMGGILIQAVREGHRVACVVATGDYTSWANTVGREEAYKRQQLELAERFGYESDS